MVFGGGDGGGGGGAGPTMRVTVLGCGGSSGVPMIGGIDGTGDWGACDPTEPRNRRTRSSIVIESATGQRLLVDTGTDLRQQLIENAIPRIDAILFTHAHADHISGLDEVRSLNRITGAPIAAYATAKTLADLETRFDYAFKPWTPPMFFRPVLTPQAVPSRSTLNVAGLEVDIFAQGHGRIETLGLRVGPFAYSTDVVRLDAEAFEVLAGVETWMVDCFQRDPHSSHAHLALSIEWARRLGVRRTILTHMGTDLDWGWLVANLPAGVEPAHDGMRLVFGT